MPDSEKVIREIEDALSDDLGEAGYIYGLSLVGLKDKALADALALLKEQQSQIEQLTDDKDLLKDTIYMLKTQKHCETFTVIDTKTGKEADIYNIALHEEWANHLCYCDMEGFAIENDGTLLLVDECGRFAYADRERFKVVWDA